MKTTLTHEELSAKLAKSERESRIIMAQLDKMESEVLIPEIKQKYLGRYFVTTNSYSGNEKWYLYQKVIGITDFKTVDVFKFQIDCDGVSTISTKDFTYIQLLGEEITEDEFKLHYSELIQHIAL